MQNERDWTPERIKSIRERLGITQVRFALGVGVSPTIVSLWENGKASPDPRNRKRLYEIEAELK